MSAPHWTPPFEFFAANLLLLSPQRTQRSQSRRRLDREGLDAELVCGDIMEHCEKQPYNAVCANFFLNIFPEPVMQQVLGNLVSLLSEDGLLMIAEFAADAFYRGYDDVVAGQKGS